MHFIEFLVIFMVFWGSTGQSVAESGILGLDCIDVFVLYGVIRKQRKGAFTNHEDKQGGGGLLR